MSFREKGCFLEAHPRQLLGTWRRALSSNQPTKPANKPLRKFIKLLVEANLSADLESKPSKTGITLSLLAFGLFIPSFLMVYWRNLHLVRECEGAREERVRSEA